MAVRWLTLWWQAHHGACLRQRKWPAGAFALIRYGTCPGVHHHRVVGVRPGCRVIAGWNAMIPANRPGMDLDDPDQRLGRHPRADVPLRLDRLTLRVRGENEVDPLQPGKESRARSPDDQPACLRRRDDASRRRATARGHRTLTARLRSLTCVTLSVGVPRRPLASAAVVTQLVTHRLRA